MDSGKRTMVKTAITGTLVMVFLGMVLVSKAPAGCGSSEGPKAGAIQPQSWQGPARFSPVSFVLVADDEGADDGIVGFWQAKFVSVGSPGIPDGTVVDNALVQWHSDGTEIMNSSRPPAIGNFCLGVWKKIGGSRYTVNHFTNADPTDKVGFGQIREDVILDRRATHYKGTFTIDQYDLSGTLVVHIEGTVTAHRLTVNTPIGDVL